MKKLDKEMERYIQKRMREIRGETQESPLLLDAFTEAYTSRRIFELKAECKSQQSKLYLDNRKLGSYTVFMIGDTDDECY